MFEGLILIVVVTAVVLAIRPGKKVQLAPLVIDRPGQFYITLDPQLEQLQEFLENIFSEFSLLNDVAGDIPTQYFEVYQPDRVVYLLAVGLRNGILYFQAINPGTQCKKSHEAIKQFSEQVLLHHPVVDSASVRGETLLCEAVEKVTNRQHIKCRLLT